MKRKKIYISIIFFYFFTLFIFTLKLFSIKKNYASTLAYFRLKGGFQEVGFSPESSPSHCVATSSTSWFAAVVKAWLDIPRHLGLGSASHIAKRNLPPSVGIFHSQESAPHLRMWGGSRQLSLNNGAFRTKASSIIYEPTRILFQAPPLCRMHHISPCPAFQTARSKLKWKRCFVNFHFKSCLEGPSQFGSMGRVDLPIPSRGSRNAST